MDLRDTDILVIKKDGYEFVKLPIGSTSSGGTAFSFRIRWAPYTSSRKASMACTRCTRPRSTRVHSSPATMRGTRQTGKIFSVPRSSE